MSRARVERHGNGCRESGEEIMRVEARSTAGQCARQGAGMGEDGGSGGGEEGGGRGGGGGKEKHESFQTLSAAAAPPYPRTHTPDHRAAGCTRSRAAHGNRGARLSLGGAKRRGGKCRRQKTVKKLEFLKALSPSIATAFLHTHRVAEPSVQAITELLHARRDLVERNGHPPPVALDDIHPPPVCLFFLNSTLRLRLRRETGRGFV